MSIWWRSDLTSSQKAVLGLVVYQSSERVMTRYFTSEAIFALVPRDSQKNLTNIEIVFESVTTEGIDSSSLYRDNLVNPLCASSVAFEGSCVVTTTNRKLSCGENATVCSPASGALLEAWVLQEIGPGCHWRDAQQRQRSHNYYEDKKACLGSLHFRGELATS